MQGRPWPMGQATGGWVPLDVEHKSLHTFTLGLNLTQAAIYTSHIYILHTTYKQVGEWNLNQLK